MAFLPQLPPSPPMEFVPRSLLQDALVRDWISMIVFVWVGHSFCALTGRADEKFMFLNHAQGRCSE